MQENTENIYTDAIKIYEISLVEIYKKWYDKFTISKLEKYLLYLYLTSIEEEKIIKKLIKGDEVLMEAEKIRDDLIKRETIRFYYDQELDEMIEKKSIREDALEEGMEKGVKKGLKIEKRNIAKNLLNLGMPIDTIIKATGLSKKEISKM